MDAKLRGAVLLMVLGLAAMVAVGPGCLGDSDSGDYKFAESSRSYAYHGKHVTAQDINNFVAVYPFTVRTRLDDCQTCHTGGVLTFHPEGEESYDVSYNPCNYCHLIPFPPEGETVTGAPSKMNDTLNPYGRDYLGHGRSKSALLRIEGLDSDGDGFTNLEEIQDLRFPGNPNSYPGLVLCPVIKVTMNEIKAMPAHTQFGLANATRQQFDSYATYTGVKIKDLLAIKGIDLDGSTGVDIRALDGFTRSFSVAEIRDQFPYHQFFPGFGVEDLGADCAFVEYPPETYGLGYGDTIPDEQWHILAYEREHLPLEPSYLDPRTGRIMGEGPFRNIIPPGSDDPLLNQPDRGRGQDTAGCTHLEWNFDEDKDHNAHNMVKGAVVIRINPIVDCEEFDLPAGGWTLIDENSIIIYGHGVP